MQAGQVSRLLMPALPKLCAVQSRRLLAISVIWRDGSYLVEECISLLPRKLLCSYRHPALQTLLLADVGLGATGGLPRMFGKLQDVLASERLGVLIEDRDMLRLRLAKRVGPGRGRGRHGVLKG